MSLVASGINLPPDLASTFSGIGTGAYNQIGQNYGNATAQAANDAQARGQVGSGPGSYATSRLGTTQGLDIGNLETGMGSELGTTAYQNALNQRQYQQQSELATMIGNANKPSTLEEIMSGIGGGAKATTPWLGLMKGSSQNNLNPSMASTPNPLSLMPTDPSGFENYGFPGYGGGN